VFVALARLLGNAWLALPGAFVALTLSLWPGLASGVEGGVHVGMAPARLGWALLPLVVTALGGWSEGARSFPARTVVPLAAAVVLVHPAHLPGTVVLVLLAAVAVAPRRRRVVTVLAWLGVAALLTAFWALPLLARAGETRALAWGSLTIQPAHLPLVLALAAAAVFALGAVRSPAAGVVARLPWAVGLVVALHALVLGPVGPRRLTPGRVLFVRSSVPLVYGTEWWRPHTHVTALTPIAGARPIVNGTFTHPSAVAALVYRGSAGRGAITTLVERLDGESLFGRRLDAL